MGSCIHPQDGGLEATEGKSQYSFKHYRLCLITPTSTTGSHEPRKAFAELKSILFEKGAAGLISSSTKE